MLLMFVWHGAYGQSAERRIAVDVLKTRGVRAQASWFAVVEDFPELCVLEDSERGRFAIVAKEGYGLDGDERVLAYGWKNGFRGTESAWKKNLLASYREQLAMLKPLAYRSVRQTKESGATAGDRREVVLHIGRRGEKSVVSGTLRTRQDEVEPLTSSRWGQGHPYNAMCPTSELSSGRMLAGCVATAMSQIMYYHKYPLKGTGKFVTGLKGQRVEMDFSSTEMDWNSMKPDYASGKADNTSVAKLVYANALAVSSVFDEFSTSSNNLFARTALVNFWGYSPECKFLELRFQSEASDIVKANLRQRLPVMLSGGSHSFVCDGYSDNYLHFNLGWAGAANGFYKLLVSDRVDEYRLHHRIVATVLCDIEPPKEQRRAVVAKAVNVYAPGSLASLLSEREMQTLRSLTVTGTLDGRDIALLRRMAGATDGWKDECAGLSDGGERWSGVLNTLDLSGAKIVRDDRYPYLVIPAEGCYYTWNGRAYTIEDGMSAEDYMRFLRTPLSSGYDYTFTGEGSVPLIELRTRSNTITTMMFADCQNLRTLYLPRSIKRILGRAFKRCNSLASLTVPPSVREIESGAFSQCYMLRRVDVTQIPVETCSKFSPVRVDGRYGTFIGSRHQGLFDGNNRHTCLGLFHNNRPIAEVEYKFKE